MGDVTYAKKFTMIKNKQLKLALIIGKIWISGEEQRSG